MTIPPAAKLALATVVVVAAAIGAVRYARPPRTPIVRKPVVAAPVAAPVRDVTLSKLEPPVARATPDDAPAAVESQPDAHAVSSDRPEPSAAPLEDVIAHSMPGVVLITTPKTRGSGFFVRPDLVVTNAHVVAGFMTVSVTTQNGSHIVSRVAEFSDEYDLALIPVVRTGPLDAHLPIGSSSGLRLGEGVVALGWAQTLTQSTVTRGIVTGLRQDGVRQLVQTDAVPNPGDSGGPVLNRAGEVVGVTTFRVDGASGAAGFAIAIDDVKPFIAKITGVVMTVPLGRAMGLGVAQAQPSTTDLNRAQGTSQYAAALGAIAQRAGALDDAWNRYKGACGVTRVPGGYSHEWFHLLDPRDPLHRAPEYCGSALANVEHGAAAIDAAMRAADEAARRSDVFPGTRSDLRRRYRLDYADWEK
jgi:S1-C subfamily serine protease